MTPTISTIVDPRKSVTPNPHVYMTQTISTIVDEQSGQKHDIFGLYDPNNFYYCR